MERLTKTGEVFTFPKVDPTENAYLERVQKRLAAYEDTGLEPDEVDQICRATKTMMFSSVGDFVRHSIANFDMLQAYRALGTVEELSALVKARDVIVETADDREYIDYICPKCRDIISQRCKGQKNGVYMPKYHDTCGQRLDWTRAEAEAALQEGGTHESN